MTGEQLYGRYSYEQAEQGCEVDEWSDLSESEKEVWQKMAQWASSHTPPLSDIKGHVEAAYENQGLEFDSLRRIGDLVGAEKKGGWDN